MTTLSLRPPLAADVPALSRLGVESFVAKFGHLYRPQDLGMFLEEAKSEASFAAQLEEPDARFQLAMRGADLVGYCKLGLACGWPRHARGRHVIELKQLYIDANTTGMGIGARLMDWAFAVAREAGADEMQLSVWSGNTDAQRFYARYGFARVADTTFRVGEHIDDEFLFALML